MGKKPREGASGSVRRKSGDRPDARQLGVSGCAGSRRAFLLFRVRFCSLSSFYFWAISSIDPLFNVLDEIFLLHAEEALTPLGRLRPLTTSVGGVLSNEIIFLRRTATYTYICHCPSRCGRWHHSWDGYRSSGRRCFRSTSRAASPGQAGFFHYNRFRRQVPLSAAYARTLRG